MQTLTCLFKKTWFYYLVSFVIFALITLAIFRDFWNVGYIFHDYNFFRDYPHFLNPTTGYRIQPVIYLANYLATHTFNFDPFWPKIFIMAIYITNFALAIWLMNLLTKNKIMSFLIVFLFVIYCRSTGMIYTYQAGYLVGIFLFFILLNLALYIYWLKTQKTILYIISIFIFMLMWMIYEVTIIMPVIFFFFEYFLTKNFRLRSYLKRMIPYFIVTAIYLLIFVLTTKSLGLYDGGHQRLIQREDYFLTNFPQIIIRFTYMMISHFPIIMQYGLTHADMHWLQVVKIPISVSKVVIIAFSSIAVTSAAIFVLKIPRLIKFFLASVWILIIPFAIFEGTGGMDEHYVYFSGLFFIAFFISTLWFLMRHYLFTRIIMILIILIFAIQNLRLTLAKANQWQYVNLVVKQFTSELEKKFPTRPSAPFFVSGLPFAQYNMGPPANFLYFFYHGNMPTYFYFSYFDDLNNDESIMTYLELKKCQPGEYFQQTPVAARFQNGVLTKFDLESESAKYPIDKNSINCNSNSN